MSTSHEQRTAAEPRENEVHDAFLSEIININEDVRLLHLRPSRKSKIGTTSFSVYVGRLDQ